MVRIVTDSGTYSGQEVIEICEKVPILGSGIGTVRIIYGVGKSALCGVGACYARINTGDSQGLADHAVDGLKHIGRGFVALPPGIGGCLLYLYDKKKNSEKPENRRLLNTNTNAVNF